MSSTIQLFNTTSCAPTTVEIYLLLSSYDGQESSLVITTTVVLSKEYFEKNI